MLYSLCQCLFLQLEGQFVLRVHVIFKTKTTGEECDLELLSRSD